MKGGRLTLNFKQLTFLGPWICTDDIITFFALYINNQGRNP